MSNIPFFPIGYKWVMQRGLVGYDSFSQLQPWYFVSLDHCFWATERWPCVYGKRLFVFARRQDNDDLACFVVDDAGMAGQVLIIQGWTSDGFRVIREFPDFWEWLKGVIDDIAEWVSFDESII
ncbi:hypothetical protein [Xanthomonas oryzae]|uniref:hypothetical protein n=1 Tax=Xanthomonas oryzae TaxID=347 RepID=UPI00094A0864|nr:hypothetical protein [Xanthomonas oryzae]MDI9071545.1 hypothetical protein [Xanthomonas oryzae pv. oryzae]MDI9078847.1 hypothetical protein [Xanthomonas oryzae pv. oryzae]MDI9104825.1 hypothetical protein [Xanthomonas oryzae pv. oryzae]MDI9910324.1 hypothetical protein [Xanthomonas oryzae pv. oryzae]WEK98044.1 hypothetical protein NO460_22010 [Xanthomonas oryzae pv. oryzae]